MARTTLQRHGLLWPANAHLHDGLIAQASGGSLLTGIDGDGLFDGWQWVRSPRRRTVPSAAYAGRRATDVMPRRMRTELVARRLWMPPWLHGDARRRYASFRSAVWSTEPWRWDDRLQWWWRRRYLWGLRRSMDRLGAAHDVQVAHPLVDGHFVAALAASGGATGLGDRTALMDRLFSDLLPRAIVRRRTKALFDEVFWTGETRDFARHGVAQVPHAEVVDETRLRAEWQAPLPHFGSALLLQAAWLNRHTS